MEVWIARIELCLLVSALARLQFFAFRNGSGWSQLFISFIAFWAALIGLSSLGPDHLGQLGHMAFIAFCLGLLISKPPARPSPVAEGESGHRSGREFRECSG